jgi:hypothetical protein
MGRKRALIAPFEAYTLRNRVLREPMITFDEQKRVYSVSKCGGYATRVLQSDYAALDLLARWETQGTKMRA